MSSTAIDAMNAPSRPDPTANHRRPSAQMTTVTLSNTTSLYEPHERDTISTPPTSSFPSIMSFQTLTNWWSLGPAAALSMPNDTRKPKCPLEKKYVSKEKQLAKLCSQLNQERKANCHHLRVDVCKACGTGQVYL